MLASKHCYMFVQKYYVRLEFLYFHLLNTNFVNVIKRRRNMSAIITEFKTQ